MKNFLLFAALMMVLGATAQEDPSKAYKKASRALGNYNLDQIANNADLDEAKTHIDIASAAEPTSMQAQTWITRGEIYNEICNRDLRNLMTNPKHKISFPEAALTANEAFNKAMTLQPKKWEVKDVMKGLFENSGHMNNYSAAMYEAQKYDKAYQGFNGLLQIHETLKANGQKSPLENDTKTLNDTRFAAAMSALNANMSDKAQPLFEVLYKEKYGAPEIYSALYQLNADKDINAAYQYLEAGRMQFPDDIGLLYSEINHYLKINKMEALIDKLKVAIEKEPTNVSLYSTLGNVYDNLYQKDREAGKKNTDNLKNAEMYYTKAIEMKPDYTDAIYSLGTLYFNQAAEMTKELNAMPDDFSAAGQKKYDAKKKETDEMFKKSLPFFEKVESIDPNDKNSLIALKEIYARLNNLSVSNEFKKRIDVLEKGGKNESSYFPKK